MLSNYLRVFIRNIKRNSFFTSLNVLGLTLGIGVSFVIVLYVNDEISFDKFHKNGNIKCSRVSEDESINDMNFEAGQEILFNTEGNLIKSDSFH